jgi:hypothetical protein
MSAFYFQYEVDRGDGKWLRLWRRYADRATARSWQCFIKAAWHGAPVRIVKVKDAAPTGCGEGK